ncbi:uncharacterized protein METZ01_LOCUS437507, partial [marine metagenome]
QNNFVNATDVVSVTATFSETAPSAVIVDNPSAATLTLVVGSDNRTAAYHSLSGTTVTGSNNALLLFKYTIQATGTPGENDDNGISIVANALNSNSITIRDPAGNIADNLTHSAVSDNSSVKVDTILPWVTTFEMDDREIRIGDNATVTLVFSEALCVVSSDCGGVFFDSDDDISHPNGLLSRMTSSDNRTWTGYFWPDYPDEEVDDDTNTLSLGTSYTDLAGNPGPDNETENYKVDTAPPTAVITMSDRFLRRDRTTGVSDN